MYCKCRLNYNFITFDLFYITCTGILHRDLFGGVPNLECWPYSPHILCMFVLRVKHMHVSRYKNHKPQRNPVPNHPKIIPCTTKLTLLWHFNIEKRQCVCDFIAFNRFYITFMWIRHRDQFIAVPILD